MKQKTELSLFQKNLNYLTFYLYLMNTKCKHLQDFDDEGEFETHNYFFKLCRGKLAQKIQDDSDLIINLPLFKNFFTNLNNEKEKKSTKNTKLSKAEQNLIYEIYFDYSKSLSKSKLKNKAFYLIAWSLVAMVLPVIFFVTLISSQMNFYSKTGIYSFSDFIVPYTLIFCVLMLSSNFLIRGLILQSAIKSKKISMIKFRNMYSDDYCYKRIKEAEAFLRLHYNVEDEILELSVVEKDFPENDNFFYRTIMETQTLKEIGKKQLLKINKHVYCRAVFSELFKSIKEEGIEQFQQIPFAFVTCKEKAKVDEKGNTAFTECINHLVGKIVYTDTTFNQAIQKLSKPELDIFPKYLKILEKYENILQNINISDN